MDRIAKFENLVGLETAVRSAWAGVEFGATVALRERAKAERAQAQEMLYSMIGKLSAEDMAAYGEYRKAVAAEIAASK